MDLSAIERHEEKEHNARATTARIVETEVVQEVQVVREVRAVIVVAVVFPEVVVEVLGVAVADAEEFMGNSESVWWLARVTSRGIMKGYRALVQMLRGVATNPDLGFERRVVAP